MSSSPTCGPVARPPPSWFSEVTLLCDGNGDVKGTCESQTSRSTPRVSKSYISRAGNALKLRCALTRCLCVARSLCNSFCSSLSPQSTLGFLLSLLDPHLGVSAQRSGPEGSSVSCSCLDEAFREEVVPVGQGFVCVPVGSSVCHL